MYDSTTTPRVYPVFNRFIRTFPSLINLPRCSPSQGHHRRYERRCAGNGHEPSPDDAVGGRKDHPHARREVRQRYGPVRGRGGVPIGLQPAHCETLERDHFRLKGERDVPYLYGGTTW